MDEIILEVNNLLSQGYSLNKLDKDGILGCSRKAFKSRALKIGYAYNDDIKQFIKVTNVTPSITPKESVIKVTPSVTKELKNNKNNEIKSEFRKDKAKELEERIKILEDIVLRSNSIVTPNNLTIDNEFKEDIITRSIKVSKSAMNNFNLLADTKFSMYRKQDLITKALLEFYEKYK